MIGTGESHSVREFVKVAFEYAGVEIEWQGQGIGEKGIVRSLDSDMSSPLKVGDVLVEIDPRYFRPTEIDYLLADASLTKKKLNWSPKVTFNELVRIMVDADMELAGLRPIGDGQKILNAKGINWTENKMTVK